MMAFTLHSPPPNPIIFRANHKHHTPCSTFSQNGNLSKLKLELNGALELPVCESFRCRVGRRVRYDDDDKDEDEEWGYNEEIAKLEKYSQSSRGEALLVTALVDDQEVEVLIFKGFSSCLSYRTSSDPSKSVLPKRAKIKLIDRIKAPFNPTNIEYIEKGLIWDDFQTRLPSN